jgi:hypothetical protein
MKTDLESLRTIIRAFPIHRDRKWLDEVKKEGCIFCGAPADDPHHIVGGYNGIKTSDYLTCPVCRGCHQTEAEQGNNFIYEIAWVIRRLHEKIAEDKGTGKTKMRLPNRKP